VDQKLPGSLRGNQQKPSGALRLQSHGPKGIHLSPDALRKGIERDSLNARLLEVYQSGGSILKGKGVALGREVILDIAQNLADYLAFTEKRIALPQSLAGLKAE
jgi:hypothetical protein